MSRPVVDCGRRNSGLCDRVGLRTRNLLRMYHEELPEECPPDAAKSDAFENICRFYPFPDGDPRNYHSHFQLGKSHGSAALCDAKSISFFVKDAVPEVVAAQKTAFFKKMPIAVHTFEAGLVAALSNNRGHVHVWMYHGTDPYSKRTGLYASASELFDVL